MLASWFKSGPVPDLLSLFLSMSLEVTPLTGNCSWCNYLSASPDLVGLLPLRCATCATVESVKYVVCFLHVVADLAFSLLVARISERFYNFSSLVTTESTTSRCMSLVGASRHLWQYHQI